MPNWLAGERKSFSRLAIEVLVVESRPGGSPCEYTVEAARVIWFVMGPIFEEPAAAVYTEDAAGYARRSGELMDGF